MRHDNEREKRLISETVCARQQLFNEIFLKNMLPTEQKESFIERKKERLFRRGSSTFPFQATSCLSLYTISSVFIVVRVFTF